MASKKQQQQKKKKTQKSKNNDNATKTQSASTSASSSEAPAQLAKKKGKTTLAIDVGGTGLKASCLNEDGQMLTERVRVDTPHPCHPKLLVDALADLCAPLPRWDRISVGFPGLIRKGVVVTAPNLGTEEFAGFDLAGALHKRLSAPVRAINDADMQGLAAISGHGVELVITLGTGFGTALFNNGRLQVHLEIAHHPFTEDGTYDQVIGDKSRKKLGKKKWNKLVEQAIDNMRTMVNFDRLFIGGGNAKRLTFTLPKDVSIVDNSAGILGGIKLWDDIQEDV